MEWGVSEMGYLLLAILSSMLISVIMRVSEKYSRNRLSMLAMNYVMCGAMACAFTGSIQLFPADGQLPSALALGVLNGVLYLGGFVLLQWNISKNGVVLPSTFMKLGVIVPTLAAITVFGEVPRWTQIIGILAAIAAIFLIQGEGKKEAKSISGLVILLLSGGFTDTLAKVYDVYGPAQLKDHFLLYTFAVALILCTVLCIVKKQKLGWMDVLFGLVIGIPNYFSARFLLLAVQNVPAVVAYPSYSVGGIVAVTLAGMLLFKEKLSKRKLAAMGVILAALALLNI